MNAKRMSFIALCALGLLALPAAYPLAVQAADAPAIQAKEGWYKALVDYDFVHQNVSIPPKKGVMLIDSRPAARQYDPGHIPGAVNRPFAANLRPDGLFKPAEQLRAEFLQLLNGRDPATAVHHCGSGVSTMPNLLAMEVAGLGRQALYPGSWSEWCTTHPALPVATGPA